MDVLGAAKSDPAGVAGAAVNVVGHAHLVAPSRVATGDVPSVRISFSPSRPETIETISELEKARTKRQGKGKDRRTIENQDPSEVMTENCRAGVSARNEWALVVRGRRGFLRWAAKRRSLRYWSNCLSMNACVYSVPVDVVSVVAVALSRDDGCLFTGSSSLFSDNPKPAARCNAASYTSNL